jgi:hypothetical protein
MTRLDSANFDGDWEGQLGIDYQDLQRVATGERLTAESFASRAPMMKNKSRLRPGADSDLTIFDAERLLLRRSSQNSGDMFPRVAKAQPWAEISQRLRRI